MKVKPSHRLTALLCVVALMLTLSPAAFAAETPAVSRNKTDHQYSGNYAETIKSYLYENPSAGLTRVELEWIDDELIIEDYDANFNLIGKHEVALELSVWGGFFAGEQFNFLIFGQHNYAESDNTEVIRVVKYDKNWNRLGQASVYGGNTNSIFSAGSLRCAEAGGYLYIITSHKMYKSDDGKNHQATMEVVVRQSDMAVTETNCAVGQFTGYVSHSFNQFILTSSDGSIVTANHGDAHPRAIILYRFLNLAGTDTMAPNSRAGFGYFKTDTFPGESGNNYTGAQLGGLAETSAGYLMAYSFNGGAPLGPSNVYLAYLPKDMLTNADTTTINNPQIVRVTDYNSTDKGAQCPMLVSTGPDGGWLLWNKLGNNIFGQVESPLYYARYDADGNLGAVQCTSQAVPLGCHPILYQGKVVWYTTDESIPTFYVLDETGVQSIQANSNNLSVSAFADVPTNHWAADSIRQAAQRGISNGYPDGSFKPGDPVTRAQFCTFMALGFFGKEYNAENTAWYTPYVEILQQQGILTGTQISGSTDPNIDAGISRYDMAQMMYNLLLKQNALSSGNSSASLPGDWSFIPANYQNAVSTCYSMGLLMGQPDGAFHGMDTVDRAQACSVVNRLRTYLADRNALPVLSHWSPYVVSAASNTLPPDSSSVSIVKGTRTPNSSIDSNGNIFCMECEFLMQPAGHPELFTPQANYAQTGGGMFYCCEKCKVYYLCGDCGTEEKYWAHYDSCPG